MNAFSSPASSAVACLWSSASSVSVGAGGAVADGAGVAVGVALEAGPATAADRAAGCRPAAYTPAAARTSTTAASTRTGQRRGRPAGTSQEGGAGHDTDECGATVGA